MKKSTLTLLIILGISYLSCKKNGTQDPADIFGVWKLTEQYGDIGNGSGKYIKVEEDKYVIFTSSGKMEGDAYPDLVAFKILDSVTMQVSIKNQQQPGMFRYQIVGKTLTLNSTSCIEGCGARFIKRPIK